MLCVKNRLSHDLLVFQTVVIFTLIHSCRGQSEVVGPSQPIVATVSDDVILPCSLNPVMNVFDMTVEWSRPDLERRFVLVWRDGVELQNKKDVSYEGRASLFTDELKHGNISLKVSKVKLSDEGTYRCFVPGLNRDTTVKLVLGAVSSPVVTIVATNTSINAVVLQCESKGWYPEPEVLWLDAEGNLLSAGPTETVRGPDGLYTVSSRVTVEKRHSNSFTCRVQQRNINQSRETQIHVSDDFFPVRSDSSSSSSSGSSVPVIIGLIVGVIFIVLAAVLAVWKWRKNKRGKKKKKHHEDEESQRRRGDNSRSDESEKEPLMEIKTDRDDLTTETVENQNVIEDTQTVSNLHTEEMEEKMESNDHETEVQCLMDEEKHEELMVETETLSDVDIEMEKLKKKLKTQERDEKKFEDIISRHMGQKKDKDKQISEIRKQLEEMDRQREETEQKLQSVNRREKMMEPETQKEASEKEKDQSVKDLFTAKNDLERNKAELQKQLDKTEAAMERIKNDLICTTEKKMKATNEKEKTVKKIEELEKKKEENLNITSASPLIDQTEDHRVDSRQEVAENENPREETEDQAEQEGRQQSSTLSRENRVSSHSSVESL